MTTKPGKRQLTINGLKACGWREVKPAPSRKYLAFDHNDGQGRMFVGGSGALRSGRTVSDSVSLTDTRQHKQIMDIGRGVLAPPKPATEPPTLVHEIRQQITAGVCGPEFVTPTDESKAFESAFDESDDARRKAASNL